MSSSVMCQKPTPRQPSRSFSPPKAFAHHPVTLEHVLKRLIPERKPLERKEAQKNEQDQPLALVKRLERPIEQPIVSSAMLQQVRMSAFSFLPPGKVLFEDIYFSLSLFCPDLAMLFPMSNVVI